MGEAMQTILEGALLEARRDVIPYPNRPSMVPLGVFDGGRYLLRFASSLADLEAVQRLRFEVFNLELNEGLAESYASGLDRDTHDAVCHHLMVIHKETGALAGTYRLLAGPLAAATDFYSYGEFDLRAMPAEILETGVEAGRACVHRDHRNGRVVTLLWRGIARYLTWNEKRYLFGCCSLPTLDPLEIERARRRLVASDKLHGDFFVPAHRGCALPETVADGDGAGALPSLFSSYLKLGAKVCSAPALDVAFGVSDFLILLDLEAMDPRVRASFTASASWDVGES
jgi:putative hemolysin